MTTAPTGDDDALDALARRRTSTVSVCIPARDEEATVGPIVGAVRSALVDAVGLVDEIVVADDGSTDATAREAAAAGARVVTVGPVDERGGPSDDRDPSDEGGGTGGPDDPSDGHAVRHGKGEAMWHALRASTGDLVVWLDADLEGFDPAWVGRLLAPLINDAGVTFVKGHYHRDAGVDGTGGGRVTELVARPAISTYHPVLGGIRQPLGGEYAGRRSTFERVPFAGGYGVDLGLLIDIARLDGIEAIAQVDLGVRTHRNRPVAHLGVQAAEVLHVALRRAGVAPADPPTLLRPDLGPAPIETRDRPPLVTSGV